MKRKKALELQQAWGDQPCPHPAFAKEYDLGVRTGNFICTQCGRTFSVREKVAITAARKDADAASGGDVSDA
jgi:transposase-like protein